MGKVAVTILGAILIRVLSLVVFEIILRADFFTYLEKKYATVMTKTASRKFGKLSMMVSSHPVSFSNNLFHAFSRWLHKFFMVSFKFKTTSNG